MEFEPGLEKQRPRTSQREILPGAVKPRQIEKGFIFSSETQTNTYTGLADGSQLLITTTFVAFPNPKGTVAAVPFQIAIFQDSGDGLLHTEYQIPFGSSIGAADYRITGPLAVPQISKIGNNGFNLVFQTGVLNQSGGAKTIIWVTEARLIITGQGEIA